MIKLIIHLIFFTAGAGLGIWWGVNHPSEAAVVSSQEEIQAANLRTATQDKIQLLENFLSTKPADQDATKYQQMLNDEKRKLQASPSPPPTN